MTLSQLLEKEGFTLLGGNAGAGREVTGGCCCDLLSWVMARGRRGMAWVTVQSHMNVVAIASLHEFACVILADGGVMDETALQKAAAEGIAVISAALPAYEVCCVLNQLGV